MLYGIIIFLVCIASRALGATVPCHSGIQNVGNTCFLASAIQSLYANRQFRKMILNLTEDLTELNVNEAGYWPDPNLISALKSIFIKMNHSDCTPVSLEKEIIRMLPSMGFTLGEPNDSVGAFDAILDKFPSNLKQSWQAPLNMTSSFDLYEDAIVSPYYIQKSCVESLADCFKHELESLNSTVDRLVLRVSREKWTDRGLSSCFDPIPFPLFIIETLALESVIINKGGSHYTSIVRHGEDWFYCDDSNCRILSGGDLTTTDATTHSVQFVYSKL